MKRSTRNKAKGALHAVKGTLKERAGRLVADPDLEAEGTVEKVAGKVQQVIGRVEAVVGQ